MLEGVSPVQSMGPSECSAASRQHVDLVSWQRMMFRSQDDLKAGNFLKIRWLVQCDCSTASPVKFQQSSLKGVFSTCEFWTDLRDSGCWLGLLLHVLKFVNVHGSR